MITSNIRATIDKLKSARQGIPAAIQEALSPDRYRDALLIVAEAAMLTAAENDAEREAVPILLNSMAAEKTPTGFTVSLNGFAFATTDPAEYLANTPRQEVVDWVGQHKELKEDRDFYKSGPNEGQPYPDAMIASRVVNAMKTDPDPWFRTDVPGKGALDPTGLVYLTGLTNVPQERVSALLHAALSTWTAYVRERAVHEVRFRIKEALA